MKRVITTTEYDDQGRVIKVTTTEETYNDEPWYINLDGGPTCTGRPSWMPHEVNLCGHVPEGQPYAGI